MEILDSFLIKIVKADTCINDMGTSLIKENTFSLEKNIFWSI